MLGVFGSAYISMKLERVNDPRLPKLKSEINHKNKFYNKKNKFIFYSVFYYLRRIILGLTVILLQKNLIW